MTAGNHDRAFGDHSTTNGNHSTTSQGNMKKLTINTNNNQAAEAASEQQEDSSTSASHHAELSNGSLSPLPTKLTVRIQSGKNSKLSPLCSGRLWFKGRNFGYQLEPAYSMGQGSSY